MRAVAEANTNIALVKYWGKRHSGLNLPAVGSLSLTLEGLTTRTEVRFDGALVKDTLQLNGKSEAGIALDRVSKFLDVVRARADKKERAAVVSSNNFPTASGLASSASSFAALALAACRAAKLDLSPKALSILARQGSGSAARSIFGGFVRLHRGEQADGEDCFAEGISGAEDWGVRLVIGVTHEGKKDTLSTDGMRTTAETSPYFAAWVASHPADLEAAERAIASRDFALLGEVTERSCLTMHASAMAARPAVVYFRGATVEGLHAVRKIRSEGLPAYFTCDAGPHIKVLTLATHAKEVQARLSQVPGVLRAITAAPGGAAKVVE
jgi:diphosphomevalonate decarboxylase